MCNKVVVLTYDIKYHIKWIHNSRKSKILGNEETCENYFWETSKSNTGDKYTFKVIKYKFLHYITHNCQRKLLLLSGQVIRMQEGKNCIKRLINLQKMWQHVFDRLHQNTIKLMKRLTTDNIRVMPASITFRMLGFLQFI